MKVFVMENNHRNLPGFDIDNGCGQAVSPTLLQLFASQTLGAASLDAASDTNRRHSVCTGLLTGLRI